MTGDAYPEQQQHGAADCAERGVGVADVVPLGDDVAEVVHHGLGREAQPQQALELRSHDDHRRRRREPARHGRRDELHQETCTRTRIVTHNRSR